MSLSPLSETTLAQLDLVREELTRLRARLAYIRQSGCPWCASVARGEKDAALAVESQRRSHEPS